MVARKDEEIDGIKAAFQAATGKPAPTPKLKKKASVNSLKSDDSKSSKGSKTSNRSNRSDRSAVSFKGKSKGKNSGKSVKHQ